MAIDPSLLETTARAFAGTMTSIRGRRVVKLLLREFASFDLVLPGSAQDGAALVLALDETGRAAICATDGRGPTVAIDSAAGPTADSVRTKYDFLKDSLPVVGREILPPGLSIRARIIHLSGTGLKPREKQLIRQLLPERRWLPGRSQAAGRRARSPR